MEKSKFCPALWFSGFFGLGALVHLIRLISGFSVVIAGHAIPVSVSAVAAIAFGVLSAGLLMLGCKKPCKTGEDHTSSCCK